MKWRNFKRKIIYKLGGVCFDDISLEELQRLSNRRLNNAINNPKDIDYNLVDAQKARRILDRIVGYEISPLLHKTIDISIDNNKYQGLSADRVQSIAILLIIIRENEIIKFM